MEKRVILAFVLSFVVLYAFRSLYTPAPPPESVANSQPITAPPKEAPPPTVEAPIAKPGNPPVPAEDIKAEATEELAVDTPLYAAVFSNAGAVLKSFKLKGFPDGQGQPVELINQDVGNKVGWPLAISTGDKALDDSLRGAKFVGRRESDELVFDYALNGMHAHKALKFDREKYEFTIDTRITKDGKDVPHAIVWQGSFGDQSIPEDPAKKHAVYQADASFKRVALQSLKAETQSFDTLRAGVEDQYFLAMFLAGANSVPIKVSNQEYAGAEGAPSPTLMLTVSSPAPERPFRVYVGPKQQEWLSKTDPLLAQTLDYGYFGFIAKPLVFALQAIHSYIGNFGWSIILLTVVINLVLFPLRLKQQVSMLKMQKIQPHMRRLQDQYKKLKANDPRRTQVQSEMMGLYKEHGVNPMGGCLPLLLQMPLLFGFYSALAYSIELRRAPWILWINDLSQYDPYYVIPILMAVAMIVQQKLTPTANMDPAQAKMMMLMPIVMTFMLLFVSSGLALYWLTGSVIGIIQQVFINKYWSPRAEAKLTARPKPT